MISKLQKSKTVKVIALFLAFNMFTQIFDPRLAFALTGGPSQPEVQGFTPVGTSDMVDLFSGDFQYNIPLMDIGGYPINLSYHSGIGMDQEASWVGLGWNINPGVINRNVRGIPDDFNGDQLSYEFNMKNPYTIGGSISPSGELLGWEWMEKLGLNIGANYNNYNGYGMDIGLSPTIASGAPFKNDLTTSLGLSFTLGSDATSFKPEVSFSYPAKNRKGDDLEMKNSIGLGYNSRAGLSSLTISSSSKRSFDKVKKNGDANDPNDHILKKMNINGGAGISFTTETYTPQISMPTFNTSLSFSANLGVELTGNDISAKLSGYFSGQFYKDNNKTKTAHAFGYMYSHKAVHEEDIMDFNREKDGSFTENTPNLPVTNFTYDVFSVSGQGIGGMYRPFRSEVGIVRDPVSRSHTAGIDFPGLEIAFGNTVRGGGNVGVNYSRSVSGAWDPDDATIVDDYYFKGYQESDPEYEPYYFKQAGEKTAESDPTFFSTQLGGYNPMEVNLDANHIAWTYFKDNKGNSHYPTRNSRIARQARNEAIITLNTTEAKKVGLIKEIENYDQNFTFSTSTDRYDFTQLYRDESNYPWHISEITAYRADGARYVYGIPAYNKTKEEVTFAITGGSPSQETGLVGYDDGVDNSTKNKNGLDHYYQKTTTPAYAHSYLLTAVLSQDYVDVDDNGPTENDLGSYTRINYQKLSYDYKWRVPYQSEKANYNEGLKSKGNNDADSDDKASYIYGEKEVWYIHSIETKTHVAEFHLSDRDDSYGVLSNKGGYNSNMKLKKLDKIVLYAKEDKIKEANSTSGYTAVPIKTVHFEYDYSLCENIPNNPNTSSDLGKLTLTKVYFTYQNSNRGVLSSYSFDYGTMYVDQDGTDPLEEIEVNPDYNLKGYDRWGNFSPNPIYGDGTLYTSEFPYVNQDYVPANGDDIYFDNNFQDYTSSATGRTELYDLQDSERKLADVFAHAWNLTGITLPSGGTITIEYEADDYAYVQDKRAMQMVKVAGAGENSSSTPAEILYDGSSNKNVLFIDLPKAYTSATDFINDYLKDDRGNPIDYMYFRFLVALNKEIPYTYEYVSGYATIDISQCGLASTTRGYITLEEIDVNDQFPLGVKANQISQASWNFIRLHLPKLATGAPDLNDKMPVWRTIDALGAMVKNLVTTVGGYNKVLKAQNYADDFESENSWIRLYNPDRCKQGGGHRVKKIVMSDEWNTLTGGASSNYSDATYGQEYEYTTTYNGTEISSGVAAYEPMVGNEENPWRQPVFFDEKRLLVQDDRFYQETPFGESFFPGATVGYSQVTVKNLTNTSVTEHATGKVVHGFYTAKDFPVQTNRTTLEPEINRSNPVFKLLKIYNYDFMAASQGFSIVLNDMHGKPKFQEVYAENAEEPISGIRYKYRMKASCDGCSNNYSASYDETDPAAYKYLDNEMPVMFPDGTIDEREIGVDYDCVIDMREQKSAFKGGGLGANVDGFLAAIVPLIIPTLFPSYYQEDVRFRSVVTTKVINKYGILEEVEAFDQKSSIKTTNLLFDAESGEVLLTETQNAFEDPVYTFKYPVHWMYEGMGLAYKNLGLKTYLIKQEDLADYLVPGDEIIYNDERHWVVSAVPGNIVKIKNQEGEEINLTANTYKETFKVLRSGRRNMHNNPAGQVVTLSNPLIDTDNDGLVDDLSFSKVLNASSMVYTDDAAFFECECDVTKEEADELNEYLIGVKGNWRPYKSYLYLTERTQSRANFNTNIRDDGVFTNFDPFWQIESSSNNWIQKNDDWTFTSKVTMFSHRGPEIENKDALGRYSSAVYGYNFTLPIAVGSNAQYKEIGFDGFEDYDCDECDNDHFSFEEQLDGTDVKVSEEQSHSGKRSIKVTAGNNATLEKGLKPCKDE